MDLQTNIDIIVEKYRMDTLNYLQSLIRSPSLVGQEREIQDMVTKKMGELGLEVDRWDPSIEELASHPAYVPVTLSYKNRPNVVGIYRGIGGGRSLILNGHVDVAPTGSEKLWSHSPWSGIFMNGKVYGRGSCDMKAGVVVNLLVAQVIKTIGVKLKGDLIIESVVDEEIGGNGTLACIQRGYSADAMIITEPSGINNVSIANRGAQFFRIVVKGQEGSVQYQYDLVNPIGKAVDIFKAVEAYAVMRQSSVSHPLFDGFFRTKAPLAICKMSAGEWPSTISSIAVLEGTIECLPGENIHEVKEKFKKYLVGWSAKDPWLKDNPLQIEWFGLWFDSAETDKHNPMVKLLVEKIIEVSGCEPLVEGSGGSDLRLPIIYNHIPAVLFGPAGGMIHSIDEYVEFEQVITCAKILARMVIKWCGIAE